jgi:hypothetical protein
MCSYLRSLIPSILDVLGEVDMVVGVVVER